MTSSHSAMLPALGLAAKVTRCRWRYLSALACLCATMASASIPPPQGGIPAECDAPARVFEQSSIPASFDVYATDNLHHRFGTPLVTGLQGQLGQGGNFFNATVDIEASPGMGRCDFENVTNLGGVVRHGGGGLGGGSGGGGLLALVSDLSIESLILGADGKIHIEGTIARLFQLRGTGLLFLPDLYSTEMPADAQGVFTLYSVVDIREFMLTTPTFQLGDVFTVNDGLVDGLPGFQFSTTPFAFGPDTGFTGTPFSGMATALTLHIFQAAPEPGSLALVLGALTMLAAFQLRRSTCES